MLDILKSDINKFRNQNWFKKANDSAKNLSLLDVNEIIKKTIYLSKDQANELLNLICKTHGNLFYGIGLELGAGVGFLSSIISQKKEVKKMYSLEVVENYVKLLQPKIINYYGNKNKVISTLGNFENLKYFKENSLDFIIQYDAFHHANDLKIVLDECYRILKPNSKIICIDRIQADRISNEMINRKLNIVYDKSYFEFHKIQYIPNFRRRDNGEHEIRRSEWIQYFANSQFKNITITNYINYSLKSFIKLIISYFPDFILRNTRFRYLVGEKLLDYFIGIFRSPSPKNRGKFVKQKNNIKFHKDLAVLVSEKQ